MLDADQFMIANMTPTIFILKWDQNQIMEEAYHCS